MLLEVAAKEGLISEVHAVGNLLDVKATVFLRAGGGECSRCGGKLGNSEVDL